MLTKEQIQKELNLSTGLLTKAIIDFPSDGFNKKTNPDIWSAAEVIEHIMVLEGWTNKILSGEAVPAERNSEQQIESIKSVFQNNDQRINAPDPIVPQRKTTDKEILLESVKTNRQAMLDLVASKNTAELCKGFKHFFFGEMTRVEWVYFNIYHSERHRFQLERIKAQL